MSLLFSLPPKTISFLGDLISGRKRLRQFLGALKRRIFHHRILHLELTSRCNILCRACYRTGALKEAMDLRTDMEMEDLGKILSDYQKDCLRSVVLSGGENLLHPHFFQAVSLIKKMLPDCPIVLSTNGVLLSRNPALRQRLIEAPISELQFSLHGAIQETIDKLQHGIRLRETLETIAWIMEHSPICVSVNFVVQQENLGEIIPFIELCAQFRIPRVSLTPINFAGHREDFVDYTKLWEEMHLSRILQTAIARGSELGIGISTISPSPRCTCLGDVDVIASDGTMLPCWGNYLKKKFSMGNVLDYPAKVIRQEKTWVPLIKSVSGQGPLAPLCMACWANGKHQFS
jgi:MoaA/NifB/PqqE/SkfB family radical SAM enzyme